VYLDGLGFQVPDVRGEPIVDDTFLIVFHAGPEDVKVRLPEAKWGASWHRVLDTERGFATRRRDRETFVAGSDLDVLARSLWLLRRDPD
jgi:glycogen operon protein